jgi:hypothetical protein
MTSLYTGDALEILRTFESNSFDGCLTDPPYGISFMGQTNKWDKTVPDAAVWAEVLRVLKPGASLLAFGGSRTWHRLICNIENSGFEIRDCLMWLHGQGMPKGQNIGKALLKSGHTDAAASFSGYSTALKPAWEPVTLAAKPMPSTFTFNASTYGIAGLNIEASRTDAGRYPANVLFDEPAAAMLDEQTGQVGGGFGTENRAESAGRYGSFSGATKGTIVGYGDTGGASRFFYCSKVSASERQAGLHDGQSNDHLTLKPIDLNRYLATLILPPSREDEPRRLLVPFSGSGSECIGALQAGWDEVIGIEQDAAFNEIAAARIAHWTNQAASAA